MSTSLRVSSRSNDVETGIANASNDNSTTTIARIESSSSMTNNTRDANKDVRKPLYIYIICFVGLQISYVLWGVTQENLMTTEYSFGKFKSSSFCVFANRLLALVVAFLIVTGRKFFAGQGKKDNSKTGVVRDVPFYYYAPSSLSNTISSWAQYEALKYVSFPVQVISKSCKIIPVMLVGVLINKSNYPILDYVEALLITTGVASFTFAENTGQHSKRGASEDGEFFSYGIALLFLYMLCDSFTSQWQSRVYKQFGIDQYQMMLGVNVWSMAMTFFTLMQSGEFFTSIAFLLQDHTAFWHMVVLSITSATGQLFIFYTIKELGPVILTIFMTTRQLFSLFLSCLLFAHHLSGWGFVSAFFVFVVVFYRICRKGTD